MRPSHDGFDIRLLIQKCRKAIENLLEICTLFVLAEAMVEWLRRRTSDSKTPVRITARQECLVGI